MTLKLTLFAPSSDGLAGLGRQLPPPGESLGVTSALGRAEDLAIEIERGRPDLVVAELPPLDEAALRRIEAALNGSPATSVIMLSPERSPDYLLQVMRTGVREVVPTPLANGELKAAYARQFERLMAHRGSARKGRVLAFLPAKGGSGSTFLSTNLGYALAARGQGELVNGGEAAEPPADLHDGLSLAEVILEAEHAVRRSGGVEQRGDGKTGEPGAEEVRVSPGESEETAAVGKAFAPGRLLKEDLRIFGGSEPGRDAGRHVRKTDPRGAVGDEPGAEGLSAVLGEVAFDGGIEQDAGRIGTKHGR